MTLSDVAAWHGSADGSATAVPATPVGVHTGARARARVKQSVTARARTRSTAKAHVVRFSRVVYTDAADSWIAQERSPSAKTVWATDHTAHLGTVWKPYGVWAKSYRPVATSFALLLDAVKFLLIHPARGPLSISTAILLVLLAIH